MKRIKDTEYNNETFERIYFTDIGTYAVKSSQGYNRFDYSIRKIDGGWPENKNELGTLVHHYYDYTGGSVTIHENTAHVRGWGVD